MTMESANQRKIQTVRDSFNTVYTLLEKIGEGGQGMVLRTDRPNLLVKITPPLSPSHLTQIRKNIRRIMREDLGELKIAIPKAELQLKNRAGYVMEMMDGLQPLQFVIEQSHVLLAEKGDPEGYRASGGLKRRLLILRELACTLAKLHGRGLSFGDLSPNNVFVSKSVEHHQVWLIDVDNISPHEHFGSSGLYTKGYAAPELVRGESGSNIWTDCWSFAVIALQLLTHTHPFNSGVAVEDEDPDIGEERAALGQYPWIHDPDDDANAWTKVGLPLDQLASSLSDLSPDLKRKQG